MAPSRFRATLATTVTHGEQFDSHAKPPPLADLERLHQQRRAARMVCAANAQGATKDQRREDLRHLLDMLGLQPVDDPAEVPAHTAARPPKNDPF